MNGSGQKVTNQGLWNLSTMKHLHCRVWWNEPFITQRMHWYTHHDKASYCHDNYKSYKSTSIKCCSSSSRHFKPFLLYRRLLACVISVITVWLFFSCWKIITVHWIVIALLVMVQLLWTQLLRSVKLSSPLPVFFFFSVLMSPQQKALVWVDTAVQSSPKIIKRNL